MALPGSVSTIVVNQTYLPASVGGPIPQGTVLFETPQNLALKVTDVDVWLVPDAVVGTLDGSGSLSVTLLITNDSDVAPSFTYKVTERLTTLQRTYWIELPSSFLPGPINLSDIAVTDVAPPLGTVALTKAAADLLYMPIDATPGGGATELTSYADQVADLPDYPAVLTDLAASLAARPPSLEVHVYYTGSAWPATPAISGGQYRHWHSELFVGVATQPAGMTNGDRWTPHPNSAIYDTLGS